MRLIIILFILSLASLKNECAAQTMNSDEVLLKIEQGVKTGAIAYKLTEPNEIKALFGAPQEEKERSDGGLLIIELKYYDLVFIFWKFKDDPAPYTLQYIFDQRKDISIDIRQNNKVTLRNNDDLNKIDRFSGFANISLVNLDLRDQVELLSTMNFDSNTEWPSAEKLPDGFNPGKLLEEGKNPGLGIRSLHERGIDGRGIGIAIIDQPLLLGHVEYTSRLARYDATGLVEMEPQMHGSPVASIAVGKTLGVAPKAILTYFADPSWQEDNTPYITTMKKIFELNKTLPAEEKIHVVSISAGMFPQYPKYDEWKTVLKQARDLGILVITCDQPSLFYYGGLKLIPGKDPDDPDNYVPGKYLSEKDVLRVPIGNKTIASHSGIDVYTFDREGGRSWAAPYLAGLAVLAYQVNPEIESQTVIDCLIGTATQTKAGPVVNPRGFIQRVEELRLKKQ